MSRKKKNAEQMKEDRISQLPESLITEILSLLDDMKEAVKTSLLSKRWKYSWTHLDTLVYNCDIVSNNKRKLDRFMLFVDHTLTKCVSPKIKKFSITAGSFYYFEFGKNQALQSYFRFDSLVNKWLQFVLNKDVQDIKLGLIGLDYVIPIHLYKASSLSRLEIDEVGKQYYYRCNFGRSRSTSLVSLQDDIEFLTYKKLFDVTWNMLKTLYLKSVHVNQGFMANILLGSPMLETLVLDKVGGLSRLDIKSPTLTKLKLLNLTSREMDGIVCLDIVAPSVIKLELGGSFVGFDCNLVDVTSLKKANLTFSYESIDHVDEIDEDGNCDLWSYMIGLLESVCNADELVIGAELLKALSIFELTSEDSLIFECKYLSIHSPIPVHEVPGIVCLLASSPKVENLVINVMPWQSQLRTYNSTYHYSQYVDKVFTSFNEVDYLNQRKEKFPCLKNVKIDYSERYSGGEEWSGSDKNKCFELEIVTYVVDHAPFLKKLVILSSKYNNYYDCGSMYFTHLFPNGITNSNVFRRCEIKKVDSAYEYSFYR